MIGTGMIGTGDLLFISPSGMRQSLKKPDAPLEIRNCEACETSAKALH